MPYGKTEIVSARKKLRIPDLISSKGQRKLTCLTCYDAQFARILERTSVDLVLVGDSLGNVIQGAVTTTGVTVEHIVYHTKCVSASLCTPVLVADMPFGSAGISVEKTADNAAALIRAGAEAVKIEGATAEILEQISFLTRHSIPVLGHIGLLPQSVHSLGGYKVQGKTERDRNRLISEAKALEASGCFGIVLELVAEDVASAVTNSVSIPTIGIGAGRNCDGQILVLSDMLGMNLSFSPKYLKHFARLEETISQAIGDFCDEVANSNFPS
jgi:3-methyl-2-oxobutanoate hydroxymethyltransferase